MRPGYRLYCQPGDASNRDGRPISSRYSCTTISAPARGSFRPTSDTTLDSKLSRVFDIEVPYIRAQPTPEHMAATPVTTPAVSPAATSPAALRGRARSTAIRPSEVSQSPDVSPSKVTSHQGSRTAVASQGPATFRDAYEPVAQARGGWMSVPYRLNPHRTPPTNPIATIPTATFA